MSEAFLHNPISSGGSGYELITTLEGSSGAISYALDGNYSNLYLELTVTGSWSSYGRYTYSSSYYYSEPHIAISWAGKLFIPSYRAIHTLL